MSLRLRVPRRAWAAAGALVLLASVRAGATLYIVPDDFATIQAALNATVAGDTVQVKDSASPYAEKIDFPASGDAMAGYITLEAFPGHSPAIDGSGVSGPNLVLIDSRSYVKLIGFELRNNLGVNDGSGVRILGAGSHIEIRNNRIHDIRGKHAMGITVYGTAATPISELIIDGNQITDCEPFSSEALTLNGNVMNFEVTNNLVRDVNNIGIDFIGGETDIQPDPTKVARNGVCRGNEVVRANQKGGGYAGGIYVDGGKDIVIERNTVTESDLGIEIGAENAGIVTTNITVRDNVLYRNEKAGLVFGGFDANVGRVKNSQFLNNTLYQNDTLSTGFGEVWIQYAEDNVVRNNIAYSTAQNQLVHSESGNINNALDYNLWFAAAGAGSAQFLWQNTPYGSFAAYQAGSGQDANALFGDPQFAGAGRADFHLLPASPAREGGDPAFVPGVGETDIDDAPRVNGARVDAGADEFTCGDGVTDPGEACDDSDLVDGNGCDSNCTATGCGNRIVTGGEQCDDGNTANGDCCSATCQFESAATACDDGSACTITDTCDGAGTCAGSAAPQPLGCKIAPSERSSVRLRDASNDASDALTWRWTKGATLLGDFGAPPVSTGYTLCVYDQAVGMQPRVRAEMPAAGRCAGLACWSSLASGYRYSDLYRTPDGIRTGTLRVTAAGTGVIVIRGRGANVPLPALGFTPPVTVQLHNTDGTCWEATYSSPQRNDTGQFRARSD